MKSAMHTFFKSYFSATEKVNSWTAAMFNAEQRNELLNDVMQWEHIKSNSKK